MTASTKKSTDYVKTEPLSVPKVSQETAEIISLPVTDYQKAVHFVNVLISGSCKKTNDIRFSYGNKTAQIQEFNEKLETSLTKKLPAIQEAIEKGLKLQITYSDSQRTLPHSLSFVDSVGQKQGPAIYNFPPNFNQPVSVGIIEYKDDKIVQQEDLTYNPIKEYARAVQNKSEHLAQQKSDLEHPTPYVPEPGVTDKIRQELYFKRKAFNRNILNPLKDTLKNIFRR